MSWLALAVALFVKPTAVLAAAADGSKLSFQMGGGEIADLEYHGGDSFCLRWRDPLFAENFGAHVDFEPSGDSITAFHVTINRDEFRATKAGR